MNQNRGRNIFTLGDFHLSKRSTSAYRRPQGNTNDVFERDPFKIQSYNFRYAERPVYPVRPTSRQQESGRNSVNTKPTDTFYYNPDFTSVNNNNSRDLRVNPFANDSQHARFQQQRRRKYVQGRGGSTTQGNILGSQNSYPSSMASSRDFHRQGLGQAVSYSPQLKRSFAENILEYEKTSPRASPSFVKDSFSQICQGPSALKRSRTENVLKTFSNRGHVLGSSALDMCKGVGNTSGSRTKNYLRSTETSIGNHYNNSAAFSFTNPSKTSSYDLNPSTTAMNSYSRQVNAAPSCNPLQFPLASDIKGHQSLYATSRVGSIAKRKRSSSTGCEININIKNLEDNSITDNLTIKIENDPAQENSNGPTANKLHIQNDLSASPSGQTPNIKLNINTSTSSFVIDKKLSEFSNPSGTQPTIEIKTNNNPRVSTVSLKPDIRTISSLSANRLSSWDRKVNNAKSQGESYEWLAKSQSERARQRSQALNAIYSPQLKTMATRKSNMPSTERMPSMLPWRDQLSLSRKSTTENLNKNSYSSNLAYPTTLLKSANKSCSKSPSKSPSISTSKQDVMVSTSFTTTPSKAFKVNTSPLSCCCCNSKLSLKRLILQKFHSSKQSLMLRSQKQLLNDAALPTTAKKGNGGCRLTAEQRRLNKFHLTKLPLKININVFAEKVKMFRKV